MRAVTLDALGTLLALEDPVPRLVAALGARGATVSADAARRALQAEIVHYRAHHDEAVDAAALDALRDRCTEVLRDALPAEARGVDDLRGALLASLRFRPYPEVAEVLADLRAAGKRLVVVSNWDVSLHDVLRETGLDALVDGAVTSAEVGAAKPDGAIFAAALQLAGEAAPAEALHVGDSLEADLEGARRAGLSAVLVVRDGRPPPGAIADLRALSSLAA